MKPLSSNPKARMFAEARAEFLRVYYEQLVGARVVGVGLQQDLTPIIVFEMPGGKRVQTFLSADDKGSGPGFLHGLSIRRKR